MFFPTIVAAEDLLAQTIEADNLYSDTTRDYQKTGMINTDVSLSISSLLRII